MALPVTQGLQNDQVAQKHPLLERRILPAYVVELAERLGQKPEDVAKKISPEMLKRLRSAYVAYTKEDGTRFYYHNVVAGHDAIQGSVGTDRGEGVVSADVLAQEKAEKSSTTPQEAPGADESLKSAPAGRDERGRFTKRSP